MSMSSSKLLTVSGGSPNDGARIEQDADQGAGKPQQLWKIQADNAGLYRIISAVSGKVLDVPGAATNDGVLIQQYTNNSGSNQQWGLVPAM